MSKAFLKALLISLFLNGSQLQLPVSFPQWVFLPMTQEPVFPHIYFQTYYSLNYWFLP